MKMGLLVVEKNFGSSWISEKRCQVSALPLAAEAASLIEKETFVLKFHTRVECWRLEAKNNMRQVGGLRQQKK